MGLEGVEMVVDVADDKIVGEEQESSVDADDDIICPSEEEGSEAVQHIGRYNDFFHTRYTTFISRILGFFLFLVSVQNINGHSFTGGVGFRKRFKAVMDEGEQSDMAVGEDVYQKDPDFESGGDEEAYETEDRILRTMKMTMTWTKR